MFKVEGCVNKYYIIYSNDIRKYHQDYEIAELLKLIIPDITLEEYQDILKTYDAYMTKYSNADEFYFIKKEDIDKCVDYLNEKYEIIFKLLGV